MRPFASRILKSLSHGAGVSPRRKLHPRPKHEQQNPATFKIQALDTLRCPEINRNSKLALMRFCRRPLTELARRFQCPPVAETPRMPSDLASFGQAKP